AFHGTTSSIKQFRPEGATIVVVKQFPFLLSERSKVVDPNMVLQAVLRALFHILVGHGAMREILPKKPGDVLPGSLGKSPRTVQVAGRLMEQNHVGVVGLQYHTAVLIQLDGTVRGLVVRKFDSLVVH